MRSIGRCVGKFGWQDVSGGAIKVLRIRDGRERYVAECCLEECKE